MNIFSEYPNVNSNFNSNLYFSSCFEIKTCFFEIKYIILQYNKQPDNGKIARSKITNKLKGSNKINLLQRLFFLDKGESHGTISFYLSFYCIYIPHKPTRLIL